MHFYDLWKNTRGIKKFKNIKKVDFRINELLVNWESFEISEILLCFLRPLLKALEYTEIRALRRKEEESKNPPPRRIGIWKIYRSKKA